LDQDLINRTDEQLLESARNGNSASFGELIRRYEAKVAKTVIGMLGQCDEAEDIGQETFIRFYYALKRFRGESSIGTYITRIAINLSLNELKRRKRRRSLFQRIDSEVGDVSLAGDSDIHLDEEREMIRSAVEKLSPKFRAVVSLRLMEGYSTEETAKILRIPLGTVLSRLSRAQAKLQSMLHNYKKEH
jgi:RNA polymerase sigma-70 factor, ECF subfamily